MTCLGTGALPTLAKAGPMEVFGAGARSAAMAGALTASADGAEAAYHNPGALARSQPGFQLGLVRHVDRSRILLKPRPSGYDIPDLGGNNPTIPSVRTLEERQDTPPESNLLSLTIGSVLDFGTDRFRLGLIATIPLVDGAGQETWFADERERLFSNRLRYELMSTRIRRYDLQVALAYEVLDGIRFGLGLSVLPNVSSTNDVYLPNPTEQENVDLQLRAGQNASWALNAGLHWSPSERWQIGITFREELAMRVEGTNVLRIRGFDDDPASYPTYQHFTLVPFYSPASWNFGAAHSWERTLLSADVQLMLWDGYLDRAGERPGFHNTLIPRIAVEHRYSETTTARAGLAYHGSPVPSQSGRTNYVDNDRIVLGWGAMHGLNMRARDFEVSWHVQIHFLLPRDTDKEVLSDAPLCAPGVRALCDEVSDDLRDTRTGQPLPGTAGLQTGNPGFPGFVSGGWMALLGVELRYAF